MKDIAKDLEQLEVAGALIDKNTPTSSRLALFLIDNLAELFMYRKALNEFAHDSNWTYVPSRYPLKKKKEVKEHFKPKVNFFLQDLKLMSETDSIIIKIGHYIRNEAYHNGILREQIIVTFTRLYFETICKLLPVFWLGYYHSRAAETKNFLLQYGINSDAIDESILIKICQYIVHGRNISSQELAQNISEDLVVRINDVLEKIDYLSSGPGAMSPDEGLKWLQFREKGGMEFGQTKSQEEFRLFWEEVQTKLKAFKPKFSLHTLKKWNTKANAINAEKDKGRILQKFWEIDNQLIEIEIMVQEEIFRYEEEIDR
jgi:hypothetical protein